MAITVDDLTQEIFEEYGMTSLPPIEAFKLLDVDEPEILIWTQEEEAPKLKSSFYKREVYWAMSPNTVDWYVFQNGDWFQTSLQEFISFEMTATDIANIPQEKITSMFPDKEIYFKAALITNTDGEATTISEIQATSVQSYFTGQDYIYSGDELTINTRLWLSIQSVSVSSYCPKDAEIRLAFSNDGRKSYKVFKNGVWKSILLSNLHRDGMTVDEVHALEEVQLKLLLSSSLNVAVGLNSENLADTPRVYSVLFNYTQFDNPTESQVAEIITPKEIYHRNVISEDTYLYTEVSVEGIGFDDTNNQYSFYTTPNKIHLRILDMGTLIGTKCSEIFKADIVNTFDKADYRVSLTMKNSNGVAIQKGGYCLLRDAEVESEMTKGEISKNPISSFFPEYPLVFTLKHGERKTFYFRLTPTITTAGKVDANIVATSVQIN